MGPPGHFALALAAKPLVPRVPLWILLAATEVPDLLFTAFQAVGIESQSAMIWDLNQGLIITKLGSVPWSHGLLMSVVWSAAAALIAFFFTRNRRASGAIGLLIFSHWLFDFVVHVPDLPLAFDGSPVVGLGMWGSGPGLVFAIILEFVMLGSGLVIYLRTRKPQIVPANS